MLIAIFMQRYIVGADGKRVRNYYHSESVGIAAGFLIAALHHAGLATLTHTPSPMGFLNELLDRPANEVPFLLLVAGYPKPGARSPTSTASPSTKSSARSSARVARRLGPPAVLPVGPFRPARAALRAAHGAPSPNRGVPTHDPA